ncbi:hypothetical protein PAXINDRAFT_14965 [Paxillus involutus ATCC 200175]|uniref:Unplaced genomic scaffold PAXINscaffold_45, whole genome shotgun sequence n=1 Tax=Paxillus involutus ATCC 200175 TaxID=664439 RepID=A0A0C9STN7_PAXIN|nr:hypothetical protein PAXINDRAFT_14965 [Paxillus involutus ATCC 200175]
MVNVVIAGESGIGKSSIINLITGRNVAKTSNDTAACTLQVESYNAHIDGRDFEIWDTPGLEEGSVTAVNARLSEVVIQSLQQLKRNGGIHLLVYCMHGNRAKAAILNNYKAICSLVPPTTPVVAVITRLERYQDRMEDWWSKNASELSGLGMEFADHACITALADSSRLSPALRERVAHSRRAVRDLIRRSCPVPPPQVMFPSSIPGEFRDATLVARGLWSSEAGAQIRKTEKYRRGSSKEISFARFGL